MTEEEDNDCKQLSPKSKMSSIGMKSTEEENYPKDSFDRYGDDLCGLVLSYLSFEDCFRFESLSKQWKRLVYTKRNTLELSEEIVVKLLTKASNIVDPDENEFIVIFGDPMETREKNPREIDMKALDSMVKKLPFITCIDMSFKWDATERVFEILMDSYKNSVKTIHVSFWVWISHQMVDKLLDKYGPQLTTISTYSWPNALIKRHSKSLTRLRQLNRYEGFAGAGPGFPTTFAILFDEDNHLMIKGLTRYTICFVSMSDWSHWAPFVDHYKHHLKSIEIDFSEEGVKIVDLLKGLTQFTALSRLSITIPRDMSTIDTISIIFAIRLRLIGFQCKLIKELKLCINSVKTKGLLRDIWQSIHCFGQLRALSLQSDCKQIYFDDLSVNSLSGLKRLTHFSLTIPKCALNESFFDCIDTYLPHIQSLVIESRLEISRGIEESALKLSRLKRFDFKTERTSPVII